MRGHILFLGVFLPSSACSAGWHRMEPLPPGSLPKQQQVEVWQGGQRRQLHAVQLTGDSISGVPFRKPASCDSCRVSIPRAAVDSLRTGNPTAAFIKTVALTITTWITLAVGGYALGLGAD